MVSIESTTTARFELPLALDIALLDLLGEACEQSQVQTGGGPFDRCRTYAGVIDLNFPPPKLLRDIQLHLNAGLDVVKRKIGKPTLEEDHERIAAERDLVGPNRVFSVNANYDKGIDQAITAATVFAPSGLVRIEDLTVPEDCKGFARIVEKLGCRLPWVKTCAHYKSLNMLSPINRVASCKPTPRLAAEVRAGSVWPRW